MSRGSPGTGREAKIPDGRVRKAARGRKLFSSSEAEVFSQHYLFVRATVIPAVSRILSGSGKGRVGGLLPAKEVVGSYDRLVYYAAYVGARGPIHPSDVYLWLLDVCFSSCNIDGSIEEP